MSGIKQMLQKELDRVLKDRKMIVSTFIVPVVVMISILTIVSNLGQSMQQAIEDHTSIIYLENAPEEFPAFLQAIHANSEIRRVAVRVEVEQMIRDGAADLLIEFPENFIADVQLFQSGDVVPQIKTFYNPSEDYSRAAFDIFSTGALEAYRQQLLSERVPDMEELTVFTVNLDNPNMVIQDDQRAGGRMLGMMLPYFVTILLFAGAMGIGTDMVAGEKERGTMASLLVSPLKRSSIVLGKVFALMIISGISSMIYVAAMVVFMPQIMGGADFGVDLTLSLQQIVMLALLLIATAFLYSAIIVLISVFAKTVKEATTYVMPAYLLILVLGLTTMFTTRNPGDLYYLIPIYNMNLSLQGILSQEVTTLQYSISLGVTLLLGALLIGVIAKAFESEKVMSI